MRAVGSLVPKLPLILKIFMSRFEEIFQSEILCYPWTSYDRYQVQSFFFGAPLHQSSIDWLNRGFNSEYGDFADFMTKLDGTMPPRQRAFSKR